MPAARAWVELASEDGANRFGVEQTGVDCDAAGGHGGSLIVAENGNGRRKDFLHGCDLVELGFDVDTRQAALHTSPQGESGVKLNHQGSD